jgi:hypothetical protein
VSAGAAPVGAATVTPGIQFVSCPTEDPTDPQFLELCGALLDHPLSYADNIRLYPRKFAEVFRAIAGAEGAVLVHCAAGRDRTGMVMAMLLSVVGVTPEAIAEDYVDAAMRFNVGLGVEPGLTEEKAHSAAAMEERMASRRSALLAWLESLDVESYLRAGGLTSGEIDSLHAGLVQSAWSGLVKSIDRRENHRHLGASGVVNLHIGEPHDASGIDDDDGGEGDAGGGIRIAVGDIESEFGLGQAHLRTRFGEDAEGRREEVRGVREHREIESPLIDRQLRGARLLGADGDKADATLEQPGKQLPLVMGEREGAVRAPRAAVEHDDP